ncbi:hypothetical protein Dehly_0936 [Dehalogenimonas lykanthroporepellens BL-DC-9]|nr:hypothetical protein Dehly_0936 [Dehalogenimonas lykanthroporepellens BL-DC-9]
MQSLRDESGYGRVLVGKRSEVLRWWEDSSGWISTPVGKRFTAKRNRKRYDRDIEWLNQGRGQVRSGVSYNANCQQDPLLFQGHDIIVMRLTTGDDFNLY